MLTQSIASVPVARLPVILVAGLMLTFAGCGRATSWQTKVKPPVGVLFTQYSAPLTAEPNGAPVGAKVGIASTLYVRDPLITGFDVAWDDASIEAAAEQGGLSEVFYADYEVTQALGVFGRFTTRAYGR